MFDPDLEDVDRSQDKEGADKLLFRRFFFAFPLAEVGRGGGGRSSGKASIA